LHNESSVLEKEIINYHTKKKEKEKEKEKEKIDS